MRTLFIGMVCAAVALTFAGSANAGVVDDFESYTPGSGVSGGDWVTFYYYGTGYTAPDVTADGGGYDGTGKAAVSIGSSADSARAIALDPADVVANSTFILQATITHSVETNENVLLYLGDESITQASPAEYNLIWMAMRGQTSGGGYVTTVNNDKYVEHQFTQDFSALGWYEAKLEVDLDANKYPTEVRGYYRDTPGSGEWTLAQTSGFNPDGGAVDWTLTHAAFRFGNTDNLKLDNFGPVIPEPTTLVVLGISGVLSVLARRRRS